MEVEAKVGGTFGAFGPACNVVSPLHKLEEDGDLASDGQTNWEVNAYPNPFSNTITLSHNAIGREVSIRVMDMLGKVVYETKSNDSEITIGEGLSKGVYSVSIDIDRQRKVIKIVKE